MFANLMACNHFLDIFPVIIIVMLLLLAQEGGGFLILRWSAHLFEKLIMIYYVTFSNWKDAVISVSWFIRFRPSSNLAELLHFRLSFKVICRKHRPKKAKPDFFLQVV